MKRFLAIVLVLVLALSVFTGCKKTDLSIFEITEGVDEYVPPIGMMRNLTIRHYEDKPIRFIKLYVKAGQDYTESYFTNGNWEQGMPWEISIDMTARNQIKYEITRVEYEFG